MKHPSITNRRSTPIVRLLREIVAMIVRWTGFSLVIRQTICRRRATIVVYHDPRPHHLEKHLRYLAKRYAFVSLSSLVDALRENQWGKIPSHALVVTLDDGHKDNSHLIHIFEKYGVLPTVFVCSHLVGTCRQFWWTGAESVAPAVKKLPHRDAMILLKDTTGYFPEREYGTRAVLTEDELLALSSHAEIGSHSCYHPILVNCEYERCGKEISSSKLKLEGILNTKVSHFSYPNGDYGAREAVLAFEAGFRSARTLDVGWVSKNADPTRLKALCVQDDGSLNVLCAQVSGVFQYLHYLIHGSWNGRRPWGLS